MKLGLGSYSKGAQRDWGLTIKHNDEEEGPQRLDKVYRKLKNQKCKNNAVHTYYVEEDPLDDLAALLPGGQFGHPSSPRSLPPVKQNSGKSVAQNATRYPPRGDKNLRASSKWVATASLSGQLAGILGSPSASSGLASCRLRGPLRLPRGHDDDEQCYEARQRFSDLLPSSISEDPKVIPERLAESKRIVLDSRGTVSLEPSSIPKQNDTILALRFQISVDSLGTPEDLVELAAGYEQELGDFTSLGSRGFPGCVLVSHARKAKDEIFLEVLLWRGDLFEPDNDQARGVARPNTGQSLRRASGAKRASALEQLPGQVESAIPAVASFSSPRRSTRGSMVSQMPLSMTAPPVMTGSSSRPSNRKLGSLATPFKVASSKSASQVGSRESQETQLHIAVPGADIPHAKGAQQQHLSLIEGSSYPLRYEVSSRDVEYVQRMFETEQPLGHRAVVALLPANATVSSWESLCCKAVVMCFLDVKQSWGSTFLYVPEVTHSETEHYDNTADRRDILLELRFYISDDSEVSGALEGGKCVLVGPHIPCKILRPPAPEHMMLGMNQFLDDKHTQKKP